MKKTCTDCKIEKNYSDFSVNKRGVGGRSTKCKECRRIDSRRYWQENKDRLNAKKRSRYNKTKQISSRFGVSEIEYFSLLKEHGHECAICGSASVLSVDHDHSSGLIRGILCRRCNLAIGQFNDDIFLLEKAIHYLTRASSQGGQGSRLQNEI